MSGYCYEVYTDDIFKNNLIEETDYTYIFKFKQGMVICSKSIISKYNVLYLHYNGHTEELFLSHERRWEFKLIETKFEGEEIMKNEKNILEGHKIKKVIFKEIDSIALESALERIELGEDVQLKTKGEDTFLVTAGKSLKITGDDFRNHMEKFLVGKYINDINNPSTKKRRIMKELIMKLGIIKGFETEIEEAGLEAFFG